MATKDITDAQVCAAVADARLGSIPLLPAYELLAARTGQPAKVCWRAPERADRRGLVEYGVSLRYPWLTPAGKALIG